MSKALSLLLFGFQGACQDITWREARPHRRDRGNESGASDGPSVVDAGLGLQRVAVALSAKGGLTPSRVAVSQEEAAEVTSEEADAVIAAFTVRGRHPNGGASQKSTHISRRRIAGRPIAEAYCSKPCTSCPSAAYSAICSRKFEGSGTECLSCGTAEENAAVFRLALDLKKGSCANITQTEGEILAHATKVCSQSGAMYEWNMQRKYDIAMGTTVPPPSPSPTQVPTGPPTTDKPLAWPFDDSPAPPPQNLTEEEEEEQNRRFVEASKREENKTAEAKAQIAQKLGMRSEKGRVITRTLPPSMKDKISRNASFTKEEGTDQNRDKTTILGLLIIGILGICFFCGGQAQDPGDAEMTTDRLGDKDRPQ
eukprot:TRINITY_DN43236_c0_g1_i1.p1 TRINITY_DN43236_c0_g1~~TRINITY_DN43236_c0_g1_i1.p1  ORF type:complete len:368 (+),score=60.98 TRINITY_DN43236_c0_g1_i1:49-1152(+)